MSHYLDQAACEDAKRREDLAKSDAALKESLSESPAAIRAREFHQANDAQAMAIQMQHLDAMRCRGAL